MIKILALIRMLENYLQICENIIYKHVKILYKKLASDKF